MQNDFNNLSCIQKQDWFTEYLNQSTTPLGYKWGYQLLEGYDIACLEPSDKAVHVQSLFEGVEKREIKSSSEAVRAMEYWMQQYKFEQDEIYQILTQPAYCGLFKIPYDCVSLEDEQYVAAGHEAIITEKQFVLVSEVIKGRNWQWFI